MFRGLVFYLSLVWKVLEILDVFLISFSWLNYIDYVELVCRVVVEVV